MDQEENQKSANRPFWCSKWFMWLTLGAVVISSFDWSPQARLVDYVFSLF